MNARNEMRKALNRFGKPMFLISENKKIRAQGLFEKLKTTKNPEQLNAFEKINSFCKDKFSLWAYDYVHIKSVEKVVYKNKTFEILSGSYDENIGCWRLIIQPEKIEPADESSNKNEQIQKV